MILIHTAEEKDTRRKLVAAIMTHNNTRNLEAKNKRVRTVQVITFIIMNK